VQAAQAKLETIERERQAALEQLRTGQAELGEAKKEIQIAREGTRLERGGVKALRDFEVPGQGIEALLMAVRHGKDLQKLVKGDTPLVRYPAISPIQALQTILDRISIRNRLEGHEDELLSASFSPDGQRIVTTSRDRTARIWDISGKLLAELRGHEDWVLSASFSPDSQRIVTASEDDTARIWDISGKLLVELQGHRGDVRSASFSPDGRRIVTAADDGTARVWDIPNKLFVPFKKFHSQVLSASFSPDGQRLVTVAEDGIPRIWDISGNLLAELKGHRSDVYSASASFSPDGQRIVTASLDGTVRVWQVENLDALLRRGCDWLHDYLTNNPKATESDKQLCNPVVAFD
jgi:WD40 repeat protein